MASGSTVSILIRIHIRSSRPNTECVASSSGYARPHAQTFLLREWESGYHTDDLCFEVNVDTDDLFRVDTMGPLADGGLAPGRSRSMAMNDGSVSQRFCRGQRNGSEQRNRADRRNSRALPPFVGYPTRNRL